MLWTAKTGYHVFYILFLLTFQWTTQHSSFVRSEDIANSATTAQNIGDLKHVFGAKYWVFVAVYWRYLVRSCEDLENKFADDMENGLMEEMCRHVEQCPVLSAGQSCMVQLSVTAVRLSCCSEPTLNVSDLPESTSTTEPPKRERTPSNTTVDDLTEFDLEAQQTCNYMRALPTRRILGGTTAYVGEFPWIAMLLRNGHFLCACNILDRKHVVTAAHCFDNHLDSDEYTVLAGKYITDVTQWETNQQEAWVVGHVIHPGYDPLLKWNDVAVVLLSTPLTWTKYVMPACLPHTDDVMPQYCVVAGWGVVDDFAPSAVLMKTTLEAYSKPRCEDEFLNTSTSPASLERHLGHPGVICAANGQLGEKDACQGDSGGPLMCLQSTGTSSAYFVYGIVSNGNGCGLPGEPGLYASVAYYLSWLNATIHETLTMRR